MLVLAKIHTFNVAGTSFTVNINKNATPFDNQPYAATTASMTGIASIYQSAGQLAPRNLEDVSGFASNKPMIVSVDPSSVSFSSIGGSQTIEVTTVNQGSNTTCNKPIKRYFICKTRKWESNSYIKC